MSSAAEIKAAKRQSADMRKKIGENHVHLKSGTYHLIRKLNRKEIKDQLAADVSQQQFELGVQLKNYTGLQSRYTKNADKLTPENLGTYQVQLSYISNTDISNDELSKNLTAGKILPASGPATPLGGTSMALQQHMGGTPMAGVSNFVRSYFDLEAWKRAPTKEGSQFIADAICEAARVNRSATLEGLSRLEVEGYVEGIWLKPFSKPKPSVKTGRKTGRQSGVKREPVDDEDGLDSPSNKRVAMAPASDDEDGVIQ